MAKKLLTKQETQNLVDAVWAGKLTESKLPDWLFDKLSDGFTQAASAGWGNPLGEGITAQDKILESAFQENLFYFAARKTAHQLKEMQQLMTASGSKYEFAKQAIKLDEKWNYHWYNTEANVTQRLARSGREWQRLEATADIYPLLRFVAVQDSNTRDEHRALHGIVQPVESPFWKSYMPPLDWNCRCMVERVTDDGTPETDISDRTDLPPTEPQFTDRVTESKRIWHESHPYFDQLSAKAEKAVAKLVQAKQLSLFDEPTPEVRAPKPATPVIADYDKAAEATQKHLNKKGAKGLDTVVEYTGGSHTAINDLRRGTNAGIYEKWTPASVKKVENQTEILSKAIDDAPKYKGTTYRGFALHTGAHGAELKDLTKQLESGVFIDKGFLSASIEKDIAEGFIADATGSNYKRFILQMDGGEGMALEGITRNKREFEVLYQKNSKWKVAGMETVVDNVGQATTIVKLKAIPNEIKVPKPAPKPKAKPAPKHKPETHTDYNEAVKAARKHMLQSDEYTEALQEYTANQYSPINTLQRTGTIDYISDLEKRKIVINNSKKLAEIMSEALSTSPKFEGLTYRGIGFGADKESVTLYNDLIKQAKSGIFLDKGYFSTSAEQSVALAFMESGGGEFGIIYKIKGKSGVPIEGLAHIKNEKEVLFNKNSKFRVTNITKPASHVTEITLEEI